jgi:hypothetical protein
MRVACLILLAALPLYPQAAAEPSALQGTISNDLNGQPLPKAFISLQRTGPGPASYTAVTDATGKFAITRIEPGPYRMQVVRTGFVSLNSTVTIAKPIDNMLLRMTPQAVITGRLLDEDGDPVANARVQAYVWTFVQGRRQPTAGGFAQTDDRGEYRIFGLPPGSYHLSANAMPSPAALPYLPADVLAPLAVAPAAQVRAPDIKLPAAHTVHVRGRISTAVPGQRMFTLYLIGPHFSSQQPVSAKGDFEIPHVVPDRYTLQAGFPAEGAYYAANVSVDVKDKDVDGVTIAIAKPLSVSGRLVAETPLDTAPLLVHAQLQHVTGMAMLSADSKVAADKTFRFPEISPGSYTLSVENLPEGFYIKSPDVFEVKPAAPPIQLTIAPATGSVSGKTSPGAIVAVINGKITKAATADAAGAFTIRSLPPGDYQAYAWTTPEKAGYLDAEYMKTLEGKGVLVSVTAADQEITVVPR